MSRGGAPFQFTHASLRGAARHASSGCSSRKLGYPTKAKARTDAARLMKERGSDLSIYRCPECRMFHTTGSYAEGRTTNGTRRKGAA